MVMEASTAKAGGRKRMEGEGILGCGGGTMKMHGSVTPTGVAALHRAAGGQGNKRGTLLCRCAMTILVRWTCIGSNGGIKRSNMGFYALAEHRVEP